MKFDAKNVILYHADQTNNIHSIKIVWDVPLIHLASLHSLIPDVSNSSHYVPYFNQNH